MIPFRVQWAWLVATTLAYGALGELHFQNRTRTPDASGACGVARPVYDDLMFGLALLILLVSTSWLARRGGTRWIWSTLTHTALAAAAGTALGAVYHTARTEFGPSCPEIQFVVCVWCGELPWYVIHADYVALPAIAVLLSPAIGYAARRVRG